jgi:molybdopterin-dependent oxidoreductase-like protein protein
MSDWTCTRRRSAWHWPEEAGVDPKAKWFIAEGADAPHLTHSVLLKKAWDDVMIPLCQNGERLMPATGYAKRLLLPGYEGYMNVQYLRRIGGHSVWLTRRFPSVAWDRRKMRCPFPTETDAARTAARLRPSGPLPSSPSDKQLAANTVNISKKTLGEQSRVTSDQLHVDIHLLPVQRAGAV